MNKWTNGSQIVKSESRPEGEGWYAVVNLKRVSGSSYEPYRKGSEAWLKAANKALASAAREGFERGRR